MKRNRLLDLEQKCNLGKISQDMVGDQNNVISRVLGKGSNNAKDI